MLKRRALQAKILYTISMVNRLNPGGPPNVHPDDVALYLEAKLTKRARESDLPAVKRVHDAIESDPAVREYVEQLERLLDPDLHPYKYPGTN